MGNKLKRFFFFLNTVLKGDNFRTPPPLLLVSLTRFQLTVNERRLNGLSAVKGIAAAARRSFVRKHRVGPNFSPSHERCKDDDDERW